jgi:antirestriction protein
MTIKQKFSSIDQSKLTADQKSFLDKIKNVTKNFSDAEMNKKVEQPLDNFIAKAKEKMPEAIKSAPVKKTASAKPSQTRKPKRTAMSLAKEIRKEGESWADARARASKTMKDDSKDLSKTVETELDKLSKLVKSAKTRSKLVGISNTDIKRDSVRRAKPRGARRVTHSGETSNQYGTFNNKLGRKYYESRDRHSDRLAPNYPKNAPLLQSGAYLTDGTFGNFQNQVFAEGGDIDAFTLRMVKSNGFQPAEVLKEDTNVKYAGGGIFGTGRLKSALMRDRKNVNHSEDYEVRYSKPRPSRTGYKGVRKFATGGRVESLTKELHRLQRDLNSSRLQTYRLGDNSQEEIDRSNERAVKLARFNEVLKELRESDAKFELGGTVITDLAGHTGGGDAGYNTGMPLDGFSNTTYTGLVGETGAMSSGELFMNGGGLPCGVEQSYIITEALGNPAQHFAKGGSITNERKHVNHSEDYEVRYAKPRPSRKGYKGARKFMTGGMNNETPRIYVADLEAYNSGRLVGEWLDLADYDNADELDDAIQALLDGWGVEEYAIHDVEYIPNSMYSEYMGKRDFEELYEMMDSAKQNDLPLEVVQEIISQYDASAVDEFQGKYDSATDFAEQLVDDLGGIQNFNDFQYYLDVSETDRRLLSQEMADSYVDDIRDEDGGNRLIEEAGLNVDEYEDASDETKEELLDLARSMVYDEYYDNWYEGLNDPYYFLVEEQGLYDAESFANASFVRVDYDKLADALEQDYTIIEYDGDVYVFNIR